MRWPSDLLKLIKGTLFKGPTFKGPDFNQNIGLASLDDDFTKGFLARVFWISITVEEGGHSAGRGQWRSQGLEFGGGGAGKVGLEF